MADELEDDLDFARRWIMQARSKAMDLSAFTVVNRVRTRGLAACRKTGSAGLERADLQEILARSCM